MEDIEIRLENIKSFLTHFANGRHQIEILVIHDMYGPSVTHDFDALIVSTETLKGGEAVNNVSSLWNLYLECFRKEKN